MPRRRMSLRAIARLKRENRELLDKLGVAMRVVQRTPLSTWAGIGPRVRDEITTARRLGFVVEAHVSEENVVLTAVNRVQA